MLTTISKIAEKITTDVNSKTFLRLVWLLRFKPDYLTEKQANQLDGTTDPIAYQAIQLLRENTPIHIINQSPDVAAYISSASSEGRPSNHLMKRIFGEDVIPIETQIERGLGWESDAWRHNEDDYKRRVKIEAIRLLREVQKSGGAYISKISTDEFATVPDAHDRWIAYPQKWDDETCNYLLFSTTSGQIEIEDYSSLDDCIDWLYDAVNTPVEMAIYDCGDWGIGKGEVTTEEKQSIKYSYSEALSIFQDGDELAQELFASFDIALGDAGTGDFPRLPAGAGDVERVNGSVHTFERFKDGSVYYTMAPSVIPTWDVCPREYACRNEREVKKAHREMSRQEMYWFVVPADQKNRILNRWKKRDDKVIYGQYPYMVDDRLMYGFTTNQAKEGHPFPTDRTEAFNLIYEWNQTPDGMRRSYSQGYGGQHEGTKGDGRKKAAERIAKMSGYEVEKGEIKQFVSSTKPKAIPNFENILVDEKGTPRVKIDDPFELYRSLANNFKDLRTRGGKGALSDFLKWAGVPDKDKITLLRDTEKPKDVSTSRVIFEENLPEQKGIFSFERLESSQMEAKNVN